MKFLLLKRIKGILISSVLLFGVLLTPQVHAASAVEYALLLSIISSLPSQNSPACLMSTLNASNVTADNPQNYGIIISGSSQVNTDCGLIVSSNVLVKGKASANVSSIYYGGNIVVKQPAILNAPIQQQISPFDANALNTLRTALLSLSDDLTCDHPTTVYVDQDTTLNPGTYCGGISINDANVVLNDGTYNIINGDFKVRGSSSLSAPANAAPNLIFGKLSSDQKVGNLSIITNGDVSLPSLLVAQAVPLADQDNNTSVGNELDARSVNIGNGIILAQDKPLRINQRTELNNVASSLCSFILAKQILISGKANVTNACNPTTPPG